MYSGHPHPLLSQIPLSVSPFISLPSATILPYTYAPLPSTLPLPFTSLQNQTTGGPSAEEKYIISPTSGHKASPEDIIASCKRLGQWVDDMQREGENVLRDWEEQVKGDELREKRRLAPGWLDREERVLEPERRKTGGAPFSLGSSRGAGADGGGLGAGGPAEIIGGWGHRQSQNERTTAGSEITKQGGQQQQDPSQNQTAAGDELDRAFGSMELRSN